MFISGTVLAQEDTLQGIPKIKYLIAENQLDEAQRELAQQTEILKAQNKYDSLVQYIEVAGSFALAKSDKAKAIQNAEAFIKILNEHNSPYVDKEALTHLAWIYNDAGKPARSYELLEEARDLAKTITDPEKATLANIEYKLGYQASVLGNFALSKKHYIEALRLLNQRKSDDYVFYQQTYNALGGVMYYTGKLDSANLYFKKAIEILKKTDPDDVMNRYYRPGLVSMNVAVISNALGNNTEAIKYSKEALSHFENYIKGSRDEQRIFRAQKNRLTTLENLGAFYNAIGELKRAEEIIQRAYSEKKKILEPGDPNIVISLILLAQAKMALQEYETAGNLLDESLALIENNPGVQFYWKASALNSRAEVYKKEGHTEKAAELYQKSEDLFRTSLGEEYSVDFMTELNRMSQFYAENQKPEKALALAEETFIQNRKGGFRNTLQDFNHTLNLAMICLKLNRYEEALQYSDEALLMNLKEKDTESMSVYDSIQLQYNKPLALLTNVKADYALQPNGDEVFLKSLLDRLNQGLDILEQRKSIIKTHGEVNVLIAENRELFDFAKKINLELYRLTGKDHYLVELLSQHESSVYNRIRTRLNLRDDVAFANIPPKVLQREQTLKEQLSKSITQENDMGLKGFFETNKQWQSFLDTLKQAHPRYYEMRYAKLNETLKSPLQAIPENTTVIRYVFIEDAPYAWVADANEMKLHNLDAATIQQLIEQPYPATFQVADVAPHLHTLFKALWQPFEKQINTKKIIIIPDRHLFNISFETLTPSQINTFKDLATQSLLAHYSISYNFSLLQVLKEDKNNKAFSKNFVAFAPTFSEDMKTEYLLAVEDPEQIDNTYLTLLPQPFSHDLAKQYSRVFKGDAFLNEKALKTLFTENAAEHKIIHIGTHAESNNITPELSRLVFAKSLSGENAEDNYLYTYEIYNYDLSSNLAMLTACETGKPAFQSGEGMISLAHAFTYSGSESMLTSLWKIDEKSNTEIIGYFYEHLKEGLPKDEALQQAKLKYLATADGRTLDPQYWGGLVLMGDPTPIALSSGADWLLWVVGALLFLGLLVVFYRLLKQRAVSA
tara:strand:- start:12544 stop:15759 length:3216 start_codon:yes stop_codon:yes gene_type:complete